MRMRVLGARGRGGVGGVGVPCLICPRVSRIHRSGPQHWLSLSSAEQRPATHSLSPCFSERVQAVWTGRKEYPKVMLTHCALQLYRKLPNQVFFQQMEM